MPLDPPTTTVIIGGALASSGIAGFGGPRLASALAEGLFQYSKSGVVATSVDAGTAGAGKGTGFGVLIPAPALLEALLGSFAGHGILGVFSPALAAGVANGFSASFAQASLSGVHPGVGTGAGVLRLFPSGSGSALFAAAFRAAGIVGPYADRVASAVALALDASVPAAVGALAIAGPAGTLPAAGIGQVLIA